MTRYSRALSEALVVALIAAFLFAMPFSFVGAATPAFDDAVTTAELQAKYEAAKAGGQKVRVLVVPGHEPSYGGAQYAGYYERELVIPLANAIATELRSDPNLEVLVSRGPSGWNDDFESYFERSMSSIKRFVETHKKEMKKLVRRGKVDENTEQASHNRAPDDVAYRLYGITKWSNEHDVDLMIHVHLNDTGGHGESSPGAYTGVTIYVPDSEFGNAKASKNAAEEVFQRLNAFSATSTLPIEDKGIVEDQELIALGSNNTSEVPSILIESGYIYEPKFMREEVRPLVFADMALQTAEGVKDYFGGTASGKITRALPYTWTTDVAATSTASTTPASPGIYALQAALHSLGFYPPAPSTLINCPIDGVMSGCVTDALRAFQSSKGLTPTGSLGPATRNALNALFSLVPVVEPVAPPAAAGGSAASASCTGFTGLKLGSTDTASKKEVTRLQTILSKDKSVYPEGKVTGYYGPATDKAVKTLQSQKGIAKPGTAVYGLLGPATNRALAALCAS